MIIKLTLQATVLSYLAIMLTFVAYLFEWIITLFNPFLTTLILCFWFWKDWKWDTSLKSWDAKHCSHYTTTHTLCKHGEIWNWTNLPCLNCCIALTGQWAIGGGLLANHQCASILIWRQGVWQQTVIPNKHWLSFRLPIIELKCKHDWKPLTVF